MNIKTGSCPHCGAPIYASGVWGGITPPVYTCSCVYRPATTNINSTGTILDQIKDRRATHGDVCGHFI